MSAFFVSRITVRNPDKLQEYGQAAGPTLAAFGAKVLVKGKIAKALLGDADSHVTSIVEFPTLDALNAWFVSPEYQALTGLRNSVGEMEFLAYEAPPA